MFCWRYLGILLQPSIVKYNGNLIFVAKISLKLTDKLIRHKMTRHWRIHQRFDTVKMMSSQVNLLSRITSKDTNYQIHVLVGKLTYDRELLSVEITGASNWATLQTPCTLDCFTTCPWKRNIYHKFYLLMFNAPVH